MHIPISFTLAKWKFVTGRSIITSYPKIAFCKRIEAIIGAAHSRPVAAGYGFVCGALEAYEASILITFVVVVTDTPSEPVGS